MSDTIADYPAESGIDDLDRTELAQIEVFLREWLFENHDISTKRVYIMGSWANGTARYGISDIDIRVLTPDVESVEQIERIRDQLKAEREGLPDGVGIYDVCVSNVEPDGGVRI